MTESSFHINLKEDGVQVQDSKTRRPSCLCSPQLWSSKRHPWATVGARAPRPQSTLSSANAQHWCCQWWRSRIERGPGKVVLDAGSLDSSELWCCSGHSIRRWAAILTTEEARWIRSCHCFTYLMTPNSPSMSKRARIAMLDSPFIVQLSSRSSQQWHTFSQICVIWIV